MPMNDVPMIMRIREQWILIVGGGRIGSRRYRRLRELTDHVRVVALETKLEGPEIYRRAFTPDDLEEVSWVIAATDDDALNERIAHLCRERNIAVDVVSDSSLSDFQIPSFHQRGDLLVSISTRGASPAYARQLAEEIDAMLPDTVAEVLEEMKRVREVYRARIPDQKHRAVFYRKVLAYLLEQRPPFSADAIEAIAEETMNEND